MYDTCFRNIMTYMRTSNMRTSGKTNQIFKTCPMCGTEWDSLESFLADPHLYFNGYQANFGVVNEGIFFFTHDTKHCGSTMGIKVRTFASLFSGERFMESKKATKSCPLYCLDYNNLERCDAHCENAFAREIAQEIKNRQPARRERMLS